MLSFVVLNKILFLHNDEYIVQTNVVSKVFPNNNKY